MDIFSTRELALGFWFSLAGVYLILSEKTRPYLFRLILAFVNLYIIVPVIGLIAYVFGLSLILIELDFWSMEQYKNVTLWVIFVGIYSLFKVAKSSSDKKFFKEGVLDLFKITTIFEFVVTFYSFNFWIELIIIPFITLIMLMSVVSERNEDYKDFTKFLNRIVSGVGFVVIFYVFFLIISDYKEFINKGTLYDFLIPIYLLIGIFPYLFLVMVYSEYERKFKLINLRFKNNDLARYAKIKIFFGFTYRLSYLRRWCKYIQFHNIGDKKDIDSSIKRIKFLSKRDKKVGEVDGNIGWSQYKARRYLKKFGLITGFYDHLFDGKWSASSEPLTLGDSLFSDRITYHIDGDEYLVKCLTMVLSVNEIEGLDESLNRFNSIVNLLFKKAISEDKELFIERSHIEGDEGDDGIESLCRTEISEANERFIMLQRRRFASGESIEIRLSFAVSQEDFKYTDGL